jgi:hypothetical protein
MPEVSSSSFSETDASNNSASPNGFPEGMNMSGLNDSGRAVMGAVKRMWTRLNGAYDSTGSSNGYIVTPSVALSAYVTGERYSFRANHTNTGTSTLNISAVGAKTIKKFAAGAKANLTADDIVSGLPVTVEYDGTDMVMVTPTANHVDVNALTTVTLASGDKIAIADVSDSNTPKNALASDIPNTLKATQAQMEAASADTAIVTPNTMKWHPGIAKAGAHVTVSGGTPTLALDYGLAITDNGAGDFTFTFDTAFGSAAYIVTGLGESDGTANFGRSVQVRNGGMAAGSCRVNTFTAVAIADLPSFSLTFSGDFA